MVVPKKKRMSVYNCVDHRQLNKRSEFGVCPLPGVSKLIDCLGQSHFITTVDLN